MCELLAGFFKEPEYHELLLLEAFNLNIETANLSGLEPNHIIPGLADLFACPAI